MALSLENDCHTRLSSIAVPNLQLIGVEHPGVIKDITKGVNTLGGGKSLDKFIISTDRERSLGLFLSPDDPFRKPIRSSSLATTNVLLKVTLPRRTGRKRKRQDGGQFASYAESRDTLKTICGDAQSFVRQVRDNVESFAAVAVGLVEETHRFRALPDFQYSMISSKLANSLKDNILPFEYERMKKFELDLENSGAQPDMDMIPPPTLWQGGLPFNYAYHQNPAVKVTQDSSGQQTYVNTSRIPRTRTFRVDFNVATVPSKPPDELPAETSLSPEAQAVIRKLRDLLDQTPIVTRRVVTNCISHDLEYNLRQAVQFCGYMFKSGPWCHAIVKYGVDPRTDPIYGQYQALSFQIPIREDDNGWSDQRQKYQRLAQGKPREVGSHVFDGQRVVQDGKTWQMCHITDPLLRRILQSDETRTTCDARGDGWFQNGIMAKVRIIMRDKINVIMSGGTPNDAEYERIEALPNICTTENFHLFMLRDPDTSEKEHHMTEIIRNMAKDSYVKEMKAANSNDNIVDSTIATHGEFDDHDNDDDDQDEGGNEELPL